MQSTLPGLATSSPINNITRFLPSPSIPPIDKPKQKLH